MQGDDGDETSRVENELTDGETPEALLASKEIAAAVNAAIEALSDDLRQAITLREIEGLSYEEIAEVMNCPIGTVRSRIFRAREAIAAAAAAAARHPRGRALVSSAWPRPWSNATMNSPRTPSPEQRREACRIGRRPGCRRRLRPVPLWARCAGASRRLGDLPPDRRRPALGGSGRSSGRRGFLAGIRSRLAAEPVVLAPAPAPALKAPQRPGLRRWIAPAAVAAGFVAVAAVLVVTRVVAPEDAGGAVLASTPAQPSAVGMQALQSGLRPMRATCPCRWSMAS
jgi:predicted DNA-binding protein (UPF0251 family)